MKAQVALIIGQGGSGKDTVAELISKHCNAARIAQADPMKRFARVVFGFTENQLWGPSEARNAPDDRYIDIGQWKKAYEQLKRKASFWILDVLQENPEHTDFGKRALDKLYVWFKDLARAHGIGIGDSGGEEVFYNIAINPENARVLTPRYALQTLGTEWGRYVSRDMWIKYALRIADRLLDGEHHYDRLLGLTYDTQALPPELVVITDGRFRNEVLGVRKYGGVTIQVDSPNANGAEAEAAGIVGHASEREQKLLPASLIDFRFYNDKRRGLEVCEELVAKYLVPFMLPGPMVISFERFCLDQALQVAQEKVKESIEAKTVEAKYGAYKGQKLKKLPKKLKCKKHPRYQAKRPPRVYLTDGCECWTMWGKVYG